MIKKTIAIAFVFSAALLTPSALAQSPPPAAQQAPAQQTPAQQQVPQQTTAVPQPPAKADVTCQTPRPATLPVTPVDQDEAWNPRGGEVTFTIHDKLGRIPANAIAIVCFRWAHGSAATGKRAAGEYMQAPLVRNVPSDAVGDRLLLVTIPDLPSREPGTLGSALNMVPLTEVRIMMVDTSTGTIDTDEITQVGITDPDIGMGITIVAVLLGFLALAFLGPVRKVTKNLLLRVLATDDGHASISQFQLLLWTFVIGASAIYVMSLSGELIDINKQVLILLGISGAANLGARITGAGPAPAPGTLRAPRWADLVIGSNGALDPSRVQMLFFTLITAAFVVVYIISTYTIPNIPEGFLILMGISNGVYVGAKATTPATPAGNTPAPPAPPTGG